MIIASVREYKIYFLSVTFCGRSGCQTATYRTPLNFKKIFSTTQRAVFLQLSINYWIWFNVFSQYMMKVVFSISLNYLFKWPRAKKAISKLMRSFFIHKMGEFSICNWKIRCLTHVIFTKRKWRMFYHFSPQTNAALVITSLIIVLLFKVSRAFA